MPAQPPPLPENAGLAFIGETAWPPALITHPQAEIIAAARNPTGRPNSDVLRSFIGRTGRRIGKHWQIDFPAHYTAQEAALHEKPFTLLRNSIGDRTASRDGSAVGASLLATQPPGSRKQARTHNPENLAAESSASWWINPQAQAPLRHALARLDRFLATALEASALAWTWFESEHLPDDSLLVVARDDDFTHAVLQSNAFAAWWRAYRRSSSPTQAVESFPFPWPPFTPLGALTRMQQDNRSAASRAALTGDGGQIDSSVAAAYGWPAHFAHEELLSALDQLHGRRLAARHQTGSG